MESKRTDIKLPNFQWRETPCEVCGNVVKYLNKRPHTCNNGDCRYKFEYKINKESWANHQPGLFDNKPSESTLDG
jgi:hypothetical protein